MKKDLAKKNVVIIGGGTGSFVVLNALKNSSYNLSVILTMADDGGSTGMLREDFGILPPGDVRRALVALSHSDNKILSELFNYRFQEGRGLAGHSFGNLFLTALERLTGDFRKAIDEAGKILNIKGRVIPVTLEHTHLMAKLENGRIIKGETNIDIPRHNPDLKIKKIWLEPKAKVNPIAKKVIKNADFVIIGPGDLYTSILPNLLVGGVTDSLHQSRAKKIYIMNIMTKHGETNGFRASDFVQELGNYLTLTDLDYILINTERPDAKRLRKYREEKAQFVECDEKNLKKTPCRVFKAKILRPHGLLRHDFKKLAMVLEKIFSF